MTAIRMRRGQLVILALLTAGVLRPAAGVAQQGDPFDDWLNQRIEDLAAARINQRSNTNQTEAPAAASNSTSLVDMSSASDLIGVALNLADLSTPSGTEQEGTSATTTVSGYALYAGLRGVDPLSPDFYKRHAVWRRVSLTLGYDGESGSERNVTILGAKVLLWNRRDASHESNAAALGRIRDDLRSASAAYGELTDAISEFLFTELAEELGFAPADTSEKAQEDARIRFDNEVLGNRLALEASLEKLGPTRREALDEIVESKIDVFVELDSTSRESIESIRRAPQLSVAGLSKLRSEGADEHTAELIFDYGIVRRLNLSLNAAFELRDNPMGDDQAGGRAAVQFSFQLGPERSLRGRKPIEFSLAGDGRWMEGITPTYRVQVKVTLPVLDGIDVPLSMTVASRSEFIDEAEVRGQIGFTADVARLLAARLN